MITPATTTESIEEGEHFAFRDSRWAQGLDWDNFMKSVPIEFVHESEKQCEQGKFYIERRTHIYHAIFLPWGLSLVPMLFMNSTAYVAVPWVITAVVYTVLFLPRNVASMIPILGKYCMCFRNCDEIFDSYSLVKEGRITSWLPAFCIYSLAAVDILLLWSSILMKDLRPNDALFTGFSPEPSAAVNLVIFGTQNTVLSVVIMLYMWYAFLVFLPAEFNDQMKKVKTVLKKHLLNLDNSGFVDMTNEVKSRIHSTSKSKLQDFDGDGSVDTFDAIDDTATKVVESLKNSLKTRAYPVVMTVIAFLLWPICDGYLAERAWYGTNIPAVNEGSCDDPPNNCRGCPAAVIYFFATYFVLLPAMYFACTLFVATWLYYMEAKSIVDALMDSPLPWISYPEISMTTFYYTRKFIINWKLPALLKRGEGLLGMSLLWGVIFVIFLGAKFLISGYDCIYSYGTHMIAYVVLFFWVPLVTLAQACVSIWDAQQRHIFMLAEFKYSVSLMSAEFERLTDAIDVAVENIKERDFPPKIFGLNITSQFINILYGYFLSVLAAVIGRLVFGS